MSGKWRLRVPGKVLRRGLAWRIRQLEKRRRVLVRALDELVSNSQRTRAYMIGVVACERNAKELADESHLSLDEIGRLRLRFITLDALDQEIFRLRLIIAHLQDEQKVWVPLDELNENGLRFHALKRIVVNRLWKL